MLRSAAVDMVPQVPERRAQGIVLALFFVAGMWVGWKHGPLTRPFLADTQIYYYIAERVADGVPPHVSLIDHKHQLSSLITGWTIRLGRVAGISDVSAARSASLTAAAVTVACTALLGIHLTASLGGGALAGSAMLVFSDFFSEAAMGARPQVFMAAFLTLSLTAFSRRRPVAAGVWAACSFLCWQPAVLVWAGLALAALVGHRRIQILLRLAAGALISLVLYEAYFAAHGVIGEQIRQSYLMPAHLASYAYPPLWDSISFFIRLGLPWKHDAARALPAVLLVLLGVAPLLVTLWWRRALELARERPVWLASLFCAYLGVGFTLLTHDAHPDMFFVQPYIALAAAVATTTAVRLTAVGPLRVLKWPLLAIAGAWLIWVAYGRSNMMPLGGVTLADQYDLAKQVDILFDDRGTVWAVGCPHLLALVRKPNFHTLGLLLDPKVREYVEQNGPGSAYGPVTEEHLPGAILASRVPPWVWFPALRRHYERIENASFTRMRTAVWLLRRNSPAFSAGASVHR